MKKVLIISLCFISLSVAFAQEGGAKRTILGIEHAKSTLADALKNTNKKHILVNQVVKDKATATSIAEPMLFSIYGKENIVKQRPYESYLIDGYWVIEGTLPQGMRGGTFLVILNSIDSKVIKLTHGK